VGKKNKKEAEDAPSRSPKNKVAFAFSFCGSFFLRFFFFSFFHTPNLRRLATERRRFGFFYFVSRSCLSSRSFV